METILGTGLSGTVDATSQAAPGQAGGELIKDSDTANFTQDVIEASMAVPVIVDFWAPWCGPCKTLGPIIEKAVTAARGRVRLVKVNVDENQQLAAQLRIQSLPTVFAFANGQPIDGFTGALPESQVKTFIEKVVKQGGAPADPLEEALTQAKELLEAGDFANAGGLYSQIIQAEPGNGPALAGLAQCLVKMGNLADAKSVYESAPEEVRNSTEMDSVKAALDLAEAGAKASTEIGALQARVQADPNDKEARFDLASALFVSGEREVAIDQLMELFSQDREWNESAARKQLLKFFEAMGPTDPLTIAGRRRLSAMLFS
ncbi:MAG: thioredoxin [Pseudomonadota bacterium]